MRKPPTWVVGSAVALLFVVIICSVVITKHRKEKSLVRMDNSQAPGSGYSIKDDATKKSDRRAMLEQKLKESQQHEQEQQQINRPPKRFGGGAGKDTTNTKSRFEVKGLSCDDATAKVKAEAPDVTHVVCIKDGSPVTMDFRFDRVRIFVDDNNVAVRDAVRG